MAKRKRSAPRPSASTTSGDDALTAAVLTFGAWARGRTRTMIVGGVVLTVLAMVTAVWFYQRSVQLDAATGELQELQQTVAVQDPATAVVSVQGFLNRFGGTPHEIEARLLLARVHLIGRDDPNAAVEVLQVVAPNYGSPMNVDATFMLAAALEQGERWIEAVEIYEELSNRVDLSFQRKEAAEGLARARLAQSDTAAAIEVYRSMLEELEEDDPELPRYEMRLAELTAAQG